jgi:hypothetical protein
MTTTTRVTTIAAKANAGDPDTLGDVARKVQLGALLQPVQLVKTGLTSASSFDITSAALGSNPPIGCISTLRVTAGAAAAGDRAVTDAGGTASATVAKLSDDGKTVTFEAGVTAFVMQYMARSAVDTSGAFA